MTNQERDVIQLDEDQSEDLWDKGLWRPISSEHYDSHRWYDVWRKIVQHVETEKYYEYYDNVYKNELDEDDETTTTLTEVFPVEKTIIVYE